MKIITYGFGGYDQTKPNNNVIEEIELPDNAITVHQDELAKLGQ